jgi:hypothetical protein
MRKLYRDRRGTVAFAAVVAAIPLIGAAALGAEGASWYVTKQHAQNAADAAAYSGALKRACEITGATNGVACSDTRTVDYRGKEFAAQHSFCNAGGSAYPGSNCSTPPAKVSQSVTIDVGTYNPAGTPSWTTNASGSFVRAVVSQQQPAYLAAVLGLGTINIGSTAIAQVQKLTTSPCILALSGSISFQGSPNITATGCGMASNDKAANAIDFTGGGMTINAQLSAAGGCTPPGGTFCKTALTYMPTITNPFAALDTVMATANLLALSNCPGGITAYSAATPCKNNNLTYAGNGDITLTGGVYFISGQLQIKGNGSILGTGTLVLLPGASLSMKGGGSIKLTANATVTAAQLPPALQASAGLFSDMAIYDYQTTPDSIKIGGNSQISFNGNMYLPKTSVTFQGNPTINGSTCGNQLIAASLAFNGNPTLKFDFQNQGCSSAIKPISQYVALVQ